MTRQTVEFAANPINRMRRWISRARIDTKHIRVYFKIQCRAIQLDELHSSRFNLGRLRELGSIPDTAIGAVLAFARYLSFRLFQCYNNRNVEFSIR